MSASRIKVNTRDSRKSSDNIQLMCQEIIEKKSHSLLNSQSLRKGRGCIVSCQDWEQIDCATYRKARKFVILFGREKIESPESCFSFVSATFCWWWARQLESQKKFESYFGYSSILLTLFNTHEIRNKKKVNEIFDEYCKVEKILKECSICWITFSRIALFKAFFNSPEDFMQFSQNFWIFSSFQVWNYWIETWIPFRRLAQSLVSHVTLFIWSPMSE